MTTVLKQYVFTISHQLGNGYIHISFVLVYLQIHQQFKYPTNL